MKTKKPFIIGLFIIIILLLILIGLPGYNFGKTVAVSPVETPSVDQPESINLDLLIDDAKAVIENAKPMNFHILYEYSASNGMKTEEIWHTNGKTKAIGTDNNDRLISYKLALPNENVIYEYVDNPFHPDNTVTLNEDYYPDENEHVAIIAVDWDNVTHVRTIQHLGLDAFEITEVHHNENGLTTKVTVFDSDTGLKLAEAITANGELVLDKKATLVEYRKINSQQFQFDLDMPVETIEY